MIKIKPLKQSKGMCGATTMKMVMDYYKVVHFEKYWAKLLANKINKKTGEINTFYGLSDTKMVNVARSLGFKGFLKQYSSISELKRYIRKNIPVTVNWFSPEEGGHFSVVVGFEKDDIILADPHFGKIKKQKIEEFFHRWFDFIGPPSPKNIVVREIIVICK